MSCPVCLEEVVSPVSTPCGHIQCEACIMNWIKTKINANTEPTAIPCPSCQSRFSIVTMAEVLVPEPMRHFMSPVIRKVYLPDNSDLKQRVEGLEEELKMKEASLQQALGQLAQQTQQTQEVRKTYEEAKAQEARLQTALRDQEALTQQAEARVQSEKQAHQLIQQKQVEKDALINTLKATVADHEWRMGQMRKFLVPAQNDGLFSFKDIAGQSRLSSSQSSPPSAPLKFPPFVLPPSPARPQPVAGLFGGAHPQETIAGPVGSHAKFTFGRSTSSNLKSSVAVPLASKEP